MPKIRDGKLTPKQAKFVKAKIEGKSGTEAAMIAYNTTPKTARTIASENMAKPSIIEAINTEFERQGITLERIVKPIHDALDAQKIVTSPTEPDAVVPDHAIRLKASGMAAQFMGIGKNNSGDSGNTINNFGQMVMQQKGKYSDD